MGAISLIALLIAAIAFSAGGILVGKIFVKGSKNPQKGQAYECGIPTNTSPWHQFNVGYYLFALLFLIFDVELVFMYPWAVVVKKVGEGLLKKSRMQDGFVIISVNGSEVKSLEELKEILAKIKSK